jgi:hypothetical protein
MLEWPVSFTCFLLLPPIGSDKLSPSDKYAARIIRTGFLTGLMMGAIREGSLRGASFLAENTKNLPNTRGGFIAFQRARTNAMVRAGIEKGVVNGTKFSAVLALALFGEISMDHINQKENWYHPIIGGLFSATVISLFYRFPKSYFKRAVFVGLLGSSCIGLFQDSHAYFHGKSFKDDSRQIHPDETLFGKLLAADSKF